MLLTVVLTEPFTKRLYASRVVCHITLKSTFSCYYYYYISRHLLICSVLQHCLLECHLISNFCWSGTGRREHITPVLRELHWLPVRQRIDFKLAVLVHKALHDQLPQYLAEDCWLLTDIGRRSLRSADVSTCATKRTRMLLRDRSFSIAGLCLWNSLPVALHDRDISLVQFKRLLKILWFV